MTLPFAHGKKKEGFGGWSSHEVEHQLMCASCIWASRNLPYSSPCWSNVYMISIMSSIEERWNCIFELKYTFGILLSYTFLWKWYQDYCLLIYSQNVSLKFQSILKVHFSFTSTEVWRSIRKVYFNINSINEVHLPNIPLLYFFLKVQTKDTLNVLFFPRSKSKCKVYLK